MEKHKNSDNKSFEEEEEMIDNDFNFQENPIINDITEIQNNNNSDL